MKRKLFLLFSLAAAPLSFAAEWFDNIPDAQRAAVEQKKDVLVLFRGVESGHDVPEAIFRSPHFTEVAEKDYVFVQLPIPERIVNKNSEPPASFALFFDMKGRPYYSMGHEWSNGMDCLHEELAIAAERREVFAGIWKEMEERPEGTPAWKYAPKLLAALPHEHAYVTDAYAPLALEAAEQGDCRHLLLYLRCTLTNDVAQELREELSAPGGAERLKGSEPRLESVRVLPAAYQKLVYNTLIADLMQKGKQQLLMSKDVRRDYLAIQAECAELAPQSKLTRFMKRDGEQRIRANELDDDARRLLAQRDLAGARALLEQPQQGFIMEQARRAWLGRLYAEEGKWDEAVAELKEAVALNPVGVPAFEAKRLLETIETDRDWLQELFELSAPTTEGLRAEWSGLLDIVISPTFFYRCGGVSYPQESEAVQALLERAAEEGERACIGRMLDKLRARFPELDVPKAAAGDAEAQRRLGIAFFNGLGVPVDKEKGEEWMRRSAEQGNAAAMKELFLLNLHRGDEAAGLDWLRRAAQAGERECQRALGICYLYGEHGFEQDAAKAVEWLHKAAEAGEPQAQFVLARCYRDGTGLTVDTAQFWHWLRQSAEGGYANAQYLVGSLYHHGSAGFEQDLLQAQYWYGKAAAQGVEPAENALRAIEKGSGD